MDTQRFDCKAYWDKTQGSTPARFTPMKALLLGLVIIVLAACLAVKL
jgi:hypothetical protein